MLLVPGMQTVIGPPQISSEKNGTRQMGLETCCQEKHCLETACRRKDKINTDILDATAEVDFVE